MPIGHTQKSPTWLRLTSMTQVANPEISCERLMLMIPRCFPHSCTVCSNSPHTKNRNTTHANKNDSSFKPWDQPWEVNADDPTSLTSLLYGVPEFTTHKKSPTWLMLTQMTQVANPEIRCERLMLLIPCRLPHSCTDCPNSPHTKIPNMTQVNKYDSSCKPWDQLWEVNVKDPSSLTSLLYVVPQFTTHKNPQHDSS